MHIVSRSTAVPEDDDDADALLSNRLSQSKEVVEHDELEVGAGVVGGVQPRSKWEADNRIV